jgi:hypothetical protein
MIKTTVFVFALLFCAVEDDLPPPIVSGEQVATLKELVSKVEAAHNEDLKSKLKTHKAFDELQRLKNFVDSALDADDTYDPNRAF